MKYLTHVAFSRRTIHGKKSRRFVPAWPHRSALILLTVGTVLSISVHSLTPEIDPPSQPVSGLINPQAIQFNPTTQKVYAVDAGHNSVNITDDQRHSSIEVVVGSDPVSIAVDTKTGRAYVSNSGDATVSVIDGQTDVVIATIKVGIHPYSIAANSAIGNVYVSHTFNDDLTIIDGATNQATNIKMGSSDLIQIDEKLNVIYLLGYEGGSLKVIDGATNKVTSKTVGMHAWGLTLDPAAGTLYVAKPGYNQLAALPPSASNPVMIATGAIPCAVAINPHTRLVYVVNYGDNSVTVIDSSINTPVATIPVGNHPQAIALDADEDTIYIANTHSNSVTKIDGKTNRVVATLPAGKNPYGLAINPKSGKLHVANLGQEPETVIDFRSDLPAHR